MIVISQELESSGWSPAEIPPLANSTQRLLDLDEEGRSDPRLLTLFVLQDPVLIARLLAMANSAAMLPPGAKPVCTTEGAIRVLGVLSTYTTVLGCAMEGTLLAKLGFVEERRALVKNSFANWTTARNLSRFLTLSCDDAFILQLASLLQPLGIYAALIHGGDVSSKVRGVIEAGLTAGELSSYHSWELTSYASVSAQIAAGWGAPSRVVSAIAEQETDEGVLVGATGELIKAKLAGDSQIAALVAALKGRARWSNLNTTLEIDLVQFG